MVGADLLVLFLLAVAILDKLADMDHECWRTGCSECAAARDVGRESHRPPQRPGG
jgi:hypothetical protein